MRIAALYDIHGNLPALEAVLADVRRIGVDMVVVGGDAIPGPMPCETLDLLLNLEVPVRCIKGNGEAEVLTHRAGHELVRVPEQFRDAVKWTAEQVTSEHGREIESWPSTVCIEFDGLSEVMFCHATPHSDVDVFTRLTPDERLSHVFEGCPPVVVCGHTHMQFDRTVGGIRVLNAGSVGMPYGEAGAYWLLMRPEFELRRTEYDLSSSADRIRRTAYPFAEDFAANNVLAPPEEDRMVAMFERFALGER